MIYILENNILYYFYYYEICTHFKYFQLKTNITIVYYISRYSEYSRKKYSMRNYNYTRIMQWNN